MLKRIILLFILLSSTFVLTGCIFKNNNDESVNNVESFEETSDVTAMNSSDEDSVLNEEIIKEDVPTIELSEDNVYMIESIEKLEINSLQVYISKSQEIAESRIKKELKLKSIDLSYNGSFFSFGSLFTGLKEDNGNDSPTFLYIEYNRYPKEQSIMGIKIIDSDEEDNDLLISYSCKDQEVCPQVTQGLYDLPEINRDDIKIEQDALLKIVSKYEYNEIPPIPVYGEILIARGELYGRYGKYKFDIADGNIYDEIYYIQTPLSYSDFPDADLDGLNAQEEKEYGTDDNNKDTDGDGYEDGSEILNGYNPLGSGQIKTVSALDQLKNEIEVLSDRDRDTISFIEQIKTALELYYNSEGRYPNELEPGSEISANGVVYLAQFPEALKSENGRCSDINQLTYNQRDFGDDYMLIYCLDNNDDELNLQAGINWVSSSSRD